MAQSESPLQFPPALPISARVTDIAQAIDRHQVVIVAGATGSGKTTQLPKIALAMGRGLEKIIGVTQPRRIAATSVAARVAEELGSPLGADVGYQIRFDDKTSPATYVKFMTDGILLAEIQGDPLLHRYDTLIIDEAHERTLTIDFLLGWMKRILPERPDLKVVISSATLETDRFAEFFGGAPIVEVEGRTFPVDVLYEPPDEDADLAEAVARAVETITSLDPQGDILVFLPGEREIKECEGELNARRLRHTVILPLYARLSASEQHRVFASVPQRRVILATNVAETSITIPGIVYVVDTGIARLSRYDPRSGTTRLQIEAISRASADQRKGRCGRVREGICVRLYDEQSFTSRPAFTDPEIKRTGLAGVILRMKSLRLGDVEAFPFLDPPSSKAVVDGYRTLAELGAVDDSPRKELTPLGQRLARFPIDPRIGRMVLAGAEQNCLAEVLVVAAALNVQDPRERPREHQQKADDLHRRFRDDRSDFIGLLRMWSFAKEAQKRGTSALRRTCRDNFLSFMRIREWMEIHRQLEQIAQELGIGTRGAARTDVPEDALHRALLTGLLSKIGKYKPEDRVYVGAKQTRFLIHPSSGLAKKTHEWVMAVELVETTQMFARVAAKIEPEWLIDLGDHLLRRSYADPHWSEKSARASVREHLTLFGLPVSGKDRHVDYANIEPAAARKIFLEHALVRGEYKTKAAFHAKNHALLGEVALLRAKARKSDMLADEDALLAFFDRVVPESVVNGKTFEAWREKAERQEPEILCLSLDDVLVGHEDALRPDDYPDHVTLHGVKLALSYVFDPSLDNDGITITLPLALLPQLDPGELDWTIAGWMEEKVAALLFELPRAIRREIVPSDNATHVRDLAKRLMKRKELAVPFEGGPLLPRLAKAIIEETETSARIEAEDFRLDAIATYLRLTCRVVDEAGKVIGESRDIDALFERLGARARALWSAKPTGLAVRPSGSSSSTTTKWERANVTSWDFGDVPTFVLRRVGNLDVRSYPAIRDQGSGAVDLVLVESEDSAEEVSRGGVRRLLALGARHVLSSITPRLPQAFAHPATGAMPSRAETEAFRSALVLRVIDLAFELETLDVLPRSKRNFDALLAKGLPRLDAAAKVVSSSLAPIAIELDKTLKALKSASKHPSGRHAIDDIYAQLTHLFPADLLRWVPLSRLDHYPRYLRAAQARLQRAISDPRKDADKQAPMLPLWLQFLEKAPRAKDREARMTLRWSFEELRVAIFAPELKTPSPISVAKIKEALAALR